MRGAPAGRLGWLSCIFVIAALVSAAAAPAQEGSTGSSRAAAQGASLRVAITSPADGTQIPASGEISFAANTVGAAFRCVVGTQPAEPCTSPVPYGPLDPGTSLTFAVSA